MMIRERPVQSWLNKTKPKRGKCFHLLQDICRSLAAQICHGHLLLYHRSLAVHPPPCQPPPLSSRWALQPPSRASRCSDSLQSRGLCILQQLWPQQVPSGRHLQALRKHTPAQERTSLRQCPRANFCTQEPNRFAMSSSLTSLCALPQAASPHGPYLTKQVPHSVCSVAAFEAAMQATQTRLCGRTHNCTIASNWCEPSCLCQASKRIKKWTSHCCGP